mgnify:CR=1 FL=1
MGNKFITLFDTSNNQNIQINILYETKFSIKINKRDGTNYCTKTKN